MKYFILLLSLVSVSTFAVGVTKISGKVDSFDEKTVTLTLADQRTIKIDKSSVPKDQQANLKPNGVISMPLDEKVIQKSLVQTKKK